MLSPQALLDAPEDGIASSMQQEVLTALCVVRLVRPRALGSCQLRNALHT
jgi:hypothetical protein